MGSEAVPSLFNLGTLVGEDGLPDVVGFALIKRVDRTGKVIKLINDTGSATADSTGTAFAVPAILDSGSETVLSLSTRREPATATVTLIPCGMNSNLSPVSVNVPVSRETTTLTMTQLFPGITWPEALISVGAPSAIDITALGQSIKSRPVHGRDAARCFFAAVVDNRATPPYCLSEAAPWISALMISPAGELTG